MHEEAWVVMVNLKRKLIAVAIGICLASAGVFAQKGGDKRPDKKPDKVVVQPKEKPPPRDNKGDDRKKDDKKGKP